jgi:hypothetical protein
MDSVRHSENNRSPYPAKGGDNPFASAGIRPGEHALQELRFTGLLESHTGHDPSRYLR